MRVLHIVPSYLPAVRYGGPIYSVHNLAKAQIRNGIQASVVTTSIDGPVDSAVPLDRQVDVDGVPVRYFRCQFPRRLCWSGAMARHLFAETCGYDLVHLHHIFLAPTAFGAWAARRASVPYVMSPSGALIRELIEHRSKWIKRAWLALVERRNFKSCSALHFATEWERQAAHGLGVSLGREWVLPHGADIRPRRALPVPDDAPTTILYLGRVSWEKGVDLLVRALALLPFARLVVAGNDEDNLIPRLKELASNTGVAGRVEFAGYVTGAVKQALLERAHLLVLPSISESLGNVVLEAWERDCPVVVTPGVGLSDEVQKIGGGLVAPRTVEGLASAIRSLHGDPSGARKMGEAGRAAVEQSFGWDSIAKRLESHYREIARP